MKSIKKIVEMRRYKLIVKFLLLSMLWVSGVSICKAEVVCCYDCYLVLESSYEGPGTYCVDTNGSGSYCLDQANYTVTQGNSLDGCSSGIGGTLVTPTPLTDATFLFVFLLGIYGIYTYRKRVAV
jgi:hypothetical protein